MANDAYVGKWVHPESESPLEMVGRKGDHDLDWLAGYIIGLLEVTPSDEVLDLCCGNGLLTIRVVRAARQVTGVDFSHLLLQQAQNISAADNITYLEGDARSLDALLAGRKFDKAFMSAGFQYFDWQSGQDVLRGLRKVVKPGARVAILDVPDRARRAAHLLRVMKRLLLPHRLPAAGPGDSKRFPTLHSKIAYLKRNAARALGLRDDSEIGFWWSRAVFHHLALECGYACTILDQPRENATHTYRFDALLRSNRD
jgi:ubiquinone/menaquinone biosynthesis C-methylase UbiE